MMGNIPMNFRSNLNSKPGRFLRFLSRAAVTGTIVLASTSVQAQVSSSFSDSGFSNPVQSSSASPIVNQSAFQSQSVNSSQTKLQPNNANRLVPQPPSGFNSIPFKSTKPATTVAKPATPWSANNASAKPKAAVQQHTLVPTPQVGQSKSVQPAAQQYSTAKKPMAQKPFTQRTASQSSFGQKLTPQLPSAQKSFGNSSVTQHNFKLKSAQPNRMLAKPVAATKVAAMQDKTDESTVRKPVYPMAEYLDLPNCTVDFMDVISLPAMEAGVIKELGVKEGDYVPAGKIVGRIDDEMFRIMLEQATQRFNMASKKANERNAIDASEAKFKVAKEEADITVRLASKGSRTKSDKRLALYNAELAALEVKQAWIDQADAVGEAKLEASRVKEVQKRIDRHILKTDFEVYIVEIFKKQQEYVNAGEPVLRIGRMDTLWVHGVVNIKDVNAYEMQDRPVTVQVTLARNETATFQGKIVNVGLERQGMSGYLVKAEVKNRAVGKHWVLQPLSEVKMRIHLKGTGNDAAMKSQDNGFAQPSQGFKR